MWSEMKKRYLSFTILVMLALPVPLVASTIGMSSPSLEDMIKNPEKYLGRSKVRFAVVNVTLRPDPSHRLNETYYLVHIQDSFKYNVSFVIPEQKYQVYERVGKKPYFDLIGKRGPGLTHPPNKLITNILVSKATDPYSRDWVYIFIYLSETKTRKKSKPRKHKSDVGAKISNLDYLLHMIRGRLPIALMLK